MGAWLAFLLGSFAESVLLVWIAVRIYEGAKTLASPHSTRRTTIALILPGLTCIALGGLSLFAYFGFIKMADLGQDAALSVNSPARYGKLPSDLAQKYSRTDAEYIFLFKGQLVDHYDGSGKLQRWTPTQEQIHERENLAASRAMWAVNAQVSFNLAFATWMVGLAAALLGWRAGARRPVDG